MFGKWVFSIGFITLALFGCASQPKAVAADPNDAVTVEISGTPNAQINGFYIADGNRSEFSATVPVKLQIHGCRGSL